MCRAPRAGAPISGFALHFPAPTQLSAPSVQATRAAFHALAEEPARAGSTPDALAAQQAAEVAARAALNFNALGLPACHALSHGALRALVAALCLPVVPPPAAVLPLLRRLAGGGGAADGAVDVAAALRPYLEKPAPSRRGSHSRRPRAVSLAPAAAAAPAPAAAAADAEGGDAAAGGGKAKRALSKQHIMVFARLHVFLSARADTLDACQGVRRPKGTNCEHRTKEEPWGCPP